MPSLTWTSSNLCEVAHALWSPLRFEGSPVSLEANVMLRALTGKTIVLAHESSHVRLSCKHSLSSTVQQCMIVINGLPHAASFAHEP
jgi:hypothetical protein